MHCLKRGEKPSEVRAIQLGLRSYGIASATSDYSNKRPSGYIHFKVFMLLWHFPTCVPWMGVCLLSVLVIFFHSVWTRSGHLPLEIVAVCASFWDGLFSLGFLLPAHLAFVVPGRLSVYLSVCCWY